MDDKNIKKQADSEFVCKLCDMIQKYPKIINWNQNGQMMVIFDIAQMSQLVLPQYFRHGNFSSFIRQLNMYNFHKVQKIGQKQIIFQNEHFIRGNQKNFHFIQRKKRIKQQQLANQQFKKKNQILLDEINKQTKIDEKMKQTMEILLEYKYTVIQNIKNMKTQLENVYKQLKDCRSKKISLILIQIKDKIMEEMNKLLKQSKEIDKRLQSVFLTKKDSHQIFNHQMNPMNSQMNSQFYIPVFNDDKHTFKQFLFDCHRLRSKPSFIALPSHCGFFSANDANNPSHPLFFSGPRILSQMYYGQQIQEGAKTITKQQQPDRDQDSISMDRIDEEELKKILNQKQNCKNTQNKTQNILKSQAP